jgi:azurin
MSNQQTTRSGEPHSTGRRRARRCLFGLALLLGLAAAGCSQGTYPLDIFYEMHYQQSYKSDEPPRLSAPESSVAWYPGPASTSFTDGRHLYMVNCSMCHGLTGKGDGPVLQKMVDTYGYSPVINPPDVSDNSPASIEGVLSQTSLPFGPASAMPPFGKLLLPVEMAAIAAYIGTSAPPPPPASTDGTQPPPAQPPEDQPGTLELSANGDALTFDKERLEVASGSEVVLSFNNVSTFNLHNVVIVQDGTKDDVATRGTIAGPDNDWVEPGDAAVVAYTKVLGPGEIGEVSFTAPAAGTYQFVCTFPGHNFTMFGDFVVIP